MQYTHLGNSGLKVSRIALGCMSFGDTSRGFSEWALDDDAAEPIFRQALDLGITFWDTANVYSYGSSEEIVGRAIKTFARREDIVLATKMHAGPSGQDLSRKRSWSRSTPRWPGSAPTTSTYQSLRSTVDKASRPSTPHSTSPSSLRSNR